MARPAVPSPLVAASAGVVRVVFTSCCDAVRDPRQRAWDDVAALAPHHVVLLGDSIYMDHSLGEHWRHGEPRRRPRAEFAATMHALYARQWAVSSFRRAIAGARVHAVWDDHDFGFNNARGGAPDLRDDDWMPDDRRRVARRLFEQFRDVLREQPDAYPPLPFDPEDVPPDLGSIAACVDLARGLRLHLIDARSFMERAGPRGSALGDAQRRALHAALLPEPGVNLLASSLTLDGKSSWHRFGLDDAWLHACARTHRLLMLAGDAHVHRWTSVARLHEAVASAMAQPPGYKALIGHRTGVFGVLDADAAQLVIGLWDRGRRRSVHAIRRDVWAAR